MLKRICCIITLLLLMPLLFACEKNVSFNSGASETNPVSNDTLANMDDKKSKNYSSTKEEIGEIVFEVPGYFDFRGTDQNEFEVVFGSKGAKSVGFIGFKSYEGIYTESAKLGKADLMKVFEKDLQNVKTEESMVLNNYILKVFGSSDNCTVIRALIVNDSMGTSVYTQLKVDETDPKNKNHYNDYIRMIDNAKFKVSDLELVGGIKGTTAKRDEYGVYSYISGIVKNNTSKKYSYVQITFALFDKAGNKVGTAMANENNIGAGETWKFEALALKDFSTYKLDEITGW